VEEIPAPAPAAAEAAPQEAAPAPVKKEETVTIHRQKPTSLLDNFMSKDSDKTPQNKTAGPKAAPAPAPEKPVTAETSEEAQAVGEIKAPVAAAPAPAEQTPAPTLKSGPEEAKSAPEAAESVAEVPSPVAAETAAVPSAAWHAQKGQTLRSILNDWSQTAHVDLYWSIDYDYRLPGDVTYDGNYDSAVGKLFDQFASAKPQPYGHLHRSPDGQPVLVVSSYDLSN
jgi:hypothetical protein